MAAPDTPTISTPSNPVGDGLAWAIALLPAIGLVVGLLTSIDLTIPYVGVNVALCGLDALHIKEAGYKPITAWIILIPVYLWKRAKLLGTSLVHLAVWLVLFAATIAIPYATQPAANREAACRLVTQILKEQDAAAPQCKGVTILQDPGTGFVKASALLSDGTERTITIEERNDSISVQVLPQ